jgi:hypothetical protein
MATNLQDLAQEQKNVEVSEQAKKTQEKAQPKEQSFAEKIASRRSAEAVKEGGRC